MVPWTSPGGTGQMLTACASSSGHTSTSFCSLNEGDPIRATGAQLPKGKRVKIQAQNLEFLEVSDPKAV